MMAQIALDAYENTTYAADPIQCHDCRKSWGWQLDEKPHSVRPRLPAARGAKFAPGLRVLQQGPGQMYDKLQNAEIFHLIRVRPASCIIYFSL